ncbi:hypothetical protein [Methyloglobulus sp.]|uniref:hypothetical protein n=1 Tax=Methyloglobulus sp. TaxID=2518622 RepID=UPI0032B789B2
MNNYNQNEIYEKSAVAFIDILGFKNALDDVSRARDILDALSDIKKEIDWHYSSGFYKDFKGIENEIMAFSDSIVFSGLEHAAIIVSLNALKFSQLLIRKGFLCRGAIACGNVYHKNGILFGNGLVKAYNDEMTLAKYPRIILDSNIVEMLNESNNTSDDFAGLIKTDKDGSKFLNILYEDDDKNLKAKLTDLVQNELQKISKDNHSIKQKLIWLQSEYNLV